MSYVPQDIKEAVIAKAESYIIKARGLFPSFTINMPEVGFETKSPRIAGLAYGTRKVTYNPQYFSQEDFWNRTIGHEIAHVVQKIVYPYAKQAHGPEFRYIMRLFGLNESTHHSMVTTALVEKYKYNYSCGCGGKFSLSACLHKRVQAGRHRTCRKCKGRIHFVGEL